MQRLPRYRLARPRTFLVLLVVATLAAFRSTPVRADGPRDNIATKVRPIPPAGVEIPAADRQELETGVKDLKAAISQIHNITRLGVGRRADFRQSRRLVRCGTTSFKMCMKSRKRRRC